jgi:hypothetical protein
MHQAFVDAQSDFEKRFPVVKGTLAREVQLRDAFRELQQAENARDKSPQAYQDARVRYYTLLKGETWLDEERKRISDAEAVPKIVGYLRTYDDMNRRVSQQQRTLDIVQSVKDRILSLKDDFAYTTNTFSKQIAELKNQIEIEKKKGQLEKQEVTYWIDTALNVLLVLLTLAAVAVVAKKLWAARKPQPNGVVYTPYMGNT